MKRIFVGLLILFFTGVGGNIVYAQMGGMGQGNMGTGLGPVNAGQGTTGIGNMGPGMVFGQQDPRDYASNGERIFFTGINDAGESIRFSGGPAWLWMYGGGCASCHGADGQGGFPLMMGTQIPPNITYQALIEGKHEHGGAEAGEEHEPYTDELIKRAITKGIDASGKPLDLTMPRWQMSDADLNDLIDYLKTLEPGEEPEEAVNVEHAQEIAQEYLSLLNFPDLRLAELVEYDQSFIIKFQERSTGRYAFDVLIDKRDGQIYPAMGPMMGWNTKYGGGNGMMGNTTGGMMGNVFDPAGIGMQGDMRLRLDDAQRLARQFLTQNNLAATLGEDHVHLYYGFYEFHSEQNGKPAALIAVNGYTGQVAYETWLGPIVSIIDMSGTTTSNLPQIALKPAERIVHQGDTFSVDIAVEQSAQLSGYQFELHFDPEILQAQDITEGTFLRQDNAEIFWKDPVVDNLAGQVRIVATRMTKGGVTGAGVLATVTFEATKPGETPLTVVNAILSNPTGQVLEVSISGASVIVQSPEMFWDANGDGRVDIVDLVLVGQHFGETVPAGTSPNPDVNRDGQVNVIDLVLVGQHFGEGSVAASPALLSALSEEMAPTLLKIQQELKRQPQTPEVQHTLRLVERFLSNALPAESRLYPNYPNPFNPETWIPYELATDAKVTVSIYNATGQFVRQLDLGYQKAGRYLDKERSAYWDGRDNTGQRVSSGVYFYRINAGGFSATRKMVVVK